MAAELATQHHQCMEASEISRRFFNKALVVVGYFAFLLIQQVTGAAMDTPTAMRAGVLKVGDDILW